MMLDDHPKSIMLLNVGNSDLKADGIIPSPARIEGERLWRSYEQHFFELPIIDTCLKWLRKKTAALDLLVLFDTDQDASESTLRKDGRGIALRDKDTLWFGHIIERWLREHYSDFISEVIRRDLSGFNPSMYDEAFEAFKRELASLYSSSVEVCWVLMAGGIPACNNALHLNAISRFGDRVRVIYLPDSGIPYELNVGVQVLSTFKQASAIDALQRCDFQAALDLLPENTPKCLRYLLAYARDRQNFDFERAKNNIEHALRVCHGEDREFSQSLYDEISKLVSERDLGALLLELAYNAELVYENGRYVDFLGRLFRFCEAVLRYIVERVYSLPTDISSGRRDQVLQCWRNGINRNSDLKNYLERKEINGKKLQYDEPNRRVLEFILSYLMEQEPNSDYQLNLTQKDKQKYVEIKKTLDKLSNLANLRNQSIISHGFQGVSKEDIDRLYAGQKSPVEDMKKIVNLLHIGKYDNRLKIVSEYVIDQIRRGNW